MDKADNSRKNQRTSRVQVSGYIVMRYKDKTDTLSSALRLKMDYACAAIVPLLSVSVKQDFAKLGKTTFMRRVPMHLCLLSQEGQQGRILDTAASVKRGLRYLGSALTTHSSFACGGIFAAAYVTEDYFDEM